MSLMSEKKQNGFKLAFGDGNEGVFCEISLQFVRFRTMGQNQESLDLGDMGDGGNENWEHLGTQIKTYGS